MSTATSFTISFTPTAPGGSATTQLYQLISGQKDPAAGATWFCINPADASRIAQTSLKLRTKRAEPFAQKNPSTMDRTVLRLDFRFPRTVNGAVKLYSGSAEVTLSNHVELSELERETIYLALRNILIVTQMSDSATKGIPAV